MIYYLNTAPNDNIVRNRRVQGTQTEGGHNKIVILKLAKSMSNP